MKDKRKPGQSQLDYLWVNFGNYSITNNTKEDYSQTIPSTELVLELLKNLSSQSVGSITIVDNKLTGSSVDGNQIFSIDISSLLTISPISGFGRRYITEEDKDSEYPIGTYCYYIKLSNGIEFLAPIDSLNVDTYSKEEIDEKFNIITTWKEL